LPGFNHASVAHERTDRAGQVFEGKEGALGTCRLDEPSPLVQAHPALERPEQDARQFGNELAHQLEVLDRRHDRRSLTDEELARLIAAAEQGAAIVRMTGPDRAMLYRVAVGTGFRANELRSLTPESFDLDADPPTVTVEAGYSKHRRKDVQPIRQDLADLLWPWLETRSRGRPVFESMPDKTAKMMKKDLAEAKAKWVMEVKSPEAQKERLDSSFLDRKSTRLNSSH